MFFHPTAAEARASEAPGFWDQLRDTVLAGLDIAEAELSDRPADPFVPARRELTAEELAETGLRDADAALSTRYQYWRTAGNQRTLAYVEQRLGRVDQVISGALGDD